MVISVSLLLDLVRKLLLLSLERFFRLLPSLSSTLLLCSESFNLLTGEFSAIADLDALRRLGGEVIVIVFHLLGMWVQEFLLFLDWWRVW